MCVRVVLLGIDNLSLKSNVEKPNFEVFVIVQASLHCLLVSEERLVTPHLGRSSTVHVILTFAVFQPGYSDAKIKLKDWSQQVGDEFEDCSEKDDDEEGTNDRHDSVASRLNDRLHEAHKVIKRRVVSDVEESGADFRFSLEST